MIKNITKLVLILLCHSPKLVKQLGVFLAIRAERGLELRLLNYRTEAPTDSSESGERRALSGKRMQVCCVLTHNSHGKR